jgi:pimeloyl-ACP methyl ester carboxylesterase
MAHGAGSTAAFVSRTFPSDRCGARVHCLEDRTGSTSGMAGRLREEVLALRGDYDELLLGGVSIGAHAAGLAGIELAGLVDGYVFALPGWIGPAANAGLTAAAAREIRELGPGTVLSRLRDDPMSRTDWVVDELAAAWDGRPTLVEELCAAAAEPAPTGEQLALLTSPALVLALDDDPVHPVAVARGWARALPNSRISIVGRAEPGRDRSVFGAAVRSWLGMISGNAPI